MLPLGYLDFLLLMEKCEFIMTDSGGIQEEATAPPIRKRVLATRLSTERPEAVETGFAIIIGIGKNDMLKAIGETLMDKRVLSRISPYGSGNAGVKTVKILQSITNQNR